MSQEMDDDDPYDRYHHFIEEAQRILKKVWNERDLYCEPIRMFPADVSFDGLSAGCFFGDMGNVI